MRKRDLATLQRHRRRRNYRTDCVNLHETSCGCMHSAVGLAEVGGLSVLALEGGKSAGSTPEGGESAGRSPEGGNSSDPGVGRKGHCVSSNGGLYRALILFLMLSGIGNVDSIRWPARSGTVSRSRETHPANGSPLSTSASPPEATRTTQPLSAGLPRVAASPATPSTSSTRAARPLLALRGLRLTHTPRRRSPGRVGREGNRP